MLTLMDVIINSYIAIFTPVINAFPVYTGMPVGVTSAFAFIEPYVSAGSLFYPLNGLLYIIPLMLIIQGAIFIYHVTIWGFKKVPFLNVH